MGRRRLFWMTVASCADSDLKCSPENENNDLWGGERPIPVPSPPPSNIEPCHRDVACEVRRHVALPWRPTGRDAGHARPAASCGSCMRGVARSMSWRSQPLLPETSSEERSSRGLAHSTLWRAAQAVISRPATVAGFRSDRAMVSLSCCPRRSGCVSGLRPCRARRGLSLGTGPNDSVVMPPGRAFSRDPSAMPGLCEARRPVKLTCRRDTSPLSP